MPPKKQSKKDKQLTSDKPNKELKNKKNTNDKKVKSKKVNDKKVNSKKSNKKDKLLYNATTTGMDIMAEFSERNRDVIVKFPVSCANKYNNNGSLEYNPHIIDPLPISENTQYNNIIGGSTVNVNNTEITYNNMSELQDINKKIYDNYIVSGSNSNINMQNLIMAQQSLIKQHNDINNPLHQFSTPIKSCIDSNIYNTTKNDQQSDNGIVSNASRYQKKIDDLLSEFTEPENKRAMTQIELLLHKKYNQTKQFELMYSMCNYVNSNNQWPKTSNSACMWDAHEFTYMPWGIPESYDIKTKKFSLSGIFCSPNCALSHIIATEKNTGTMWEKISLLNLLYHKVYKGALRNGDNMDTDNTNDNTQDIQKQLNEIDKQQGLTQLEKRRKKKLIKHRAKTNHQRQKTVWGSENLVPAPDKITLRLFGGPLTIEQFRCLTINNDKRYQVVFPPCNFIAPVLEETKKVFTHENNFIPIDKHNISQIEAELKIKRTMPVSTPKIKASHYK